MRKSGQTPRQAPKLGVNWLKLLGIIALVLILLGHRITRTVGQWQRPTVITGTSDNSSPNEQISPDDKRALDRTLRSGSRQ